MNADSRRLIDNVSDTARWVAAYRAAETARPDALFRDPLAAKLAGTKGPAIAAAAPREMRGGWPVVMRTLLMDELILRSIAEGADRVVNLAAGLDTRPYRLALPAALAWIEADLPGIVDEKEAMLAGEQPVCRLTRVRVDLAEAAARARFLDDAVRGAQRVLVITEGLLIYLEPAVVTALAQDLAARPAFAWWISDVLSEAVRQMIQQGLKGALDPAPMKFAPANGVAFFEALGWKPREIESTFHHAIRHRRVPWHWRILGRLAPRPDPRAPKGPWSAVVRFGR